jgi:hypothetical protein
VQKTREVHNCGGDGFAACACRTCKNDGPLLCYDHFESNSCSLVSNFRATSAREGSTQVGTTVDNVDEETTTAESARTMEDRKKASISHFLPDSEKPNAFVLTTEQFEQLVKDLKAA